MKDTANLYEKLFEHIQVFEHNFAPDEDDDWDQFIGGIKKKVLLKQIETYKKQSPGSK